MSDKRDIIKDIAAALKVVDNSNLPPAPSSEGASPMRPSFSNEMSYDAQPEYTDAISSKPLYRVPFLIA